MSKIIVLFLFSDRCRVLHSQFWMPSRTTLRIHKSYLLPFLDSFPIMKLIGAVNIILNKILCFYFT